MSRIPYYEVETATGKHAEFLGKLGTHMNIYRMLANSEFGMKGTRIQNSGRFLKGVDAAGEWSLNAVERIRFEQKLCPVINKL